MYPWDFERIRHPDEFYELIRGAQFRADQLMDLAGVISLNALTGAGAKRMDGQELTLRDVLGRDPVSLIPPRVLTDAEQEEQEWQAERQTAKNYQAQKLVLQTEFLRAQREGQSGPEIVSG